MAITSPFKKLSHSRENSREEQQPTNASKSRSVKAPSGRYPSGSSQSQSQQHKALRPASGDSRQALNKSNTINSVRSTSSTGSATALAVQYENDKKRLIQYCFSSYDKDQVLIDSYITHVRVVEDAAYPSSKPPSKSPASNKKDRILALAVKKDGEVFLHKGRENDNGSFQIGRSWSLNELSALKREIYSDVGFVATLGKDYYWETHTAKERQVFVTSLVRVYRKFKNGLVPELINWDLSLYGLDAKSYAIFLNRDLMKATPPSTSSSQNSPIAQPRIPLAAVQPQSKPPIQSLPQLQPDNSKKTTGSSTGSYVTAEAHSTSTISDAVNRDAVISGAMASSSVGTGASSIPRRPSDIHALTEAARRPSETKISANRSSLDPKSSYQSQTSLGKERYSTEPVIVTESESNESLESEINQTLQQLTLNGRTESLSAPQRNDIPKHLDPSQESLSVPQQYRPEGESLRSRPSVSRSINSIEIVAHRKSLIEFAQEQESDEEEEEDEEEDDIAMFYQTNDDDEDNQSLDSAFKADVSTSKSSNITNHEDFSFENSYEAGNASYEKISVTPATIKANVLSDDEYDDLNEDVVPEMNTPRLIIKKNPRRTRGDTINSALDTTMHETGSNSSFDDIFDIVDWDSDDDADTLTQKLMKELADTQYDTVKQLIEVREKSSGLSDFGATIIKECDKISPLLNFFSVELSGFVSNVQHIENEGQGLQVETVNKKKLWKDLHNILDTVSVDDQSLRFLLSADIDKDLPAIEPILSALQSAIVAIRGGNKDEEDLGDMKALSERRRNYEMVIARFVKNVIVDLDQRFRYTFKGMMNGNEASNDQVVRKSLSKLLVYSALTLFTKDVSEDSFDELVGTWEASANTFYINFLTNLNNILVSSTGTSDKFSLSSVSAFKNDNSTPSLRRQIDTKESKLRAKFGVTEKPEAKLNSDQSTESVSVIFNVLKSLQDHVIVQHDFLLKFFHVSRNDNLDVLEFTKKYPLQERVSILDSAVAEFETDINNAKEIHDSLSMIFEPSIDLLVKNLVQSLRNNQRNTPIVILYLELFEQKFSSSNQDYLLLTYKKLSDRLKVDWLRFIDVEVKKIDKSVLTARKIKEVSIIVKNFTKMVNYLEKDYAQTLRDFGNGVSSSTTETRELLVGSYEQLSNAIIKNLRTQDEEDKRLRFNVHEDSEDREAKNHLINSIQNSNWLIESLSPLKLPVLSSSLTSAKEIFNGARDQYVMNVQKENFGKISSFVDDVEGLIRETNSKNIDPSKRNAYNKAALNRVLNGVDSREINKIVNRIRQEVIADFQTSNDDPEIKRQLIEKIWSAIQAQAVSTALGLETIVSKYYRDVDVRFSKKEVVSAFNAARSG